MIWAWGLGVVGILGFILTPSTLARTLSNGSPSWPFQLAGLLVLWLIGLGARRLARRVQRRRARRETAADGSTQPVTLARHRAEVRPRIGPTEPLGRKLHRSIVNTVRSLWGLLAVLALMGLAVLAGMLAEWMGPNPQGVMGAGTLLAVIALGGAFVLGVIFDQRMSAAEAEFSPPEGSLGSEGSLDSGDPLEADGRPVLMLIWWPITVVAVGVGILILVVNAVFEIGAGSGLPSGLTLAVGVFGFVCLPPVVSASRAEFRGRGLRGFWSAARRTEWGDGGGG